MIRVLLALGLVIIAAVPALRMYLGRPAEGRLAPAAADMPSPIFDMPWDPLREYWKEMIVETAAILVVSSLSTGAPSASALADIRVPRHRHGRIRCAWT